MQQIKQKKYHLIETNQPYLQFVCLFCFKKTLQFASADSSALWGCFQDNTHPVRTVEGGVQPWTGTTTSMYLCKGVESCQTLKQIVFL